MKNRHCFNTLSHSQRFANNYSDVFLNDIAKVRNICCARKQSYDLFLKTRNLLTYINHKMEIKYKLYQKGASHSKVNASWVRGCRKDSR